MILSCLRILPSTQQRVFAALISTLLSWKHYVLFLILNLTWLATDVNV